MVTLVKERLPIIIFGTIILIAVLVCLFFYAPLIRDLRKYCLECRLVEADVLDARNIIWSSKEAPEKRTLMMKEDVSMAIDKLTKSIKLKGLNVISIIPRELKQDKDPSFQILPVEMKLEATYEQLGEFFGSLDDLEKCLIRINKFDISLNQDIPSKLITNLVVDVYFSNISLP